MDYRMLGPDLVRLALLLVGDRASAEDVVQDSFIAIHRAWRRLRDPGKALPYLDEVVFTVVEDQNQLVQQLQASQVDVIDEVPAANYSSLSATSGVSVLKSPQWSVDLLLLNSQFKPFKDRHVRRAVAHAVNRAPCSSGRVSHAVTDFSLPSRWSAAATLRAVPCSTAASEPVLHSVSSESAGLSPVSSASR